MTALVGARERIFVAGNHDLIRKPFYRDRVWRPARDAHQDIGGRTGWLFALEAVYCFEGKLFWPHGRPFDIPVIDDVFDDHENRWMTNFLKADKTGEAPAMYSRKLDRLRLIELYCRLLREHEELPRWDGR